MVFYLMQDRQPQKVKLEVSNYRILFSLGCNGVFGCLVILDLFYMILEE